MFSENDITKRLRKRNHTVLCTPINLLSDKSVITLDIPPATDKLFSITTGTSLTIRQTALNTVNTESSSPEASSVSSTATKSQLFTSPVRKKVSTRSRTYGSRKPVTVTAESSYSTSVKRTLDTTITFKHSATQSSTLTTADQIMRITDRPRISVSQTTRLTTTSAGEIPMSSASVSTLIFSNVTIQSTASTSGSSPSASSEDMPATSESRIENRTMTLFAEQLFNDSTDVSVTVFYSSTNNDLCLNHTFTAIAYDHRNTWVRIDFSVNADNSNNIRIEGLSPATAYQLTFESSCTVYRSANPLQIFTGK